MKIISWNIRAGGGVRAQAITDYLLGERADVIALSEFRGTPASVSIMQALANAGYVHQRTTVNRSTPALNSLLVASLHPLRRLHLNHAPDNPARWLAVNVHSPQPIAVVAVHVPNRHTGTKYPFLQAITQVASAWRGSPAIIAGDTNSGRIHLDEQVRTFNGIEDQWLRSMDHIGWRDAFRYLQPEGCEYTWYSPNGRNGFRLDQMFVHPQLVNAIGGFSHQWVGASATRREVVSDHAAMVMELNNTRANHVLS
ncbi:MAG: endonuclease/exonuclease/phosphatase family protein [Pseudomonadota bacterium]